MDGNTDQFTAWMEQMQARMLQQMQQHMQRMAEEQAQREEKLSHRLAEIEARTQTPLTSPSEPPPPPPQPASDLRASGKRPKPTLPDPPKFSGKRTEWGAWKLEMKLKLRVDAAAIGGPVEQLIYVYSRLEGDAWQMTKSYVEAAADSPTANPADLIAYMERAYGDPNQKERATNKLSSMRQGKDSVAAFLPKFERTLAEADGAEWSDVVKINTLKRMLNREVLEALIATDLPRDYHEFTRLILRTDARMRALKDSRFGSSMEKTSARPPTAATPAGGDPMDWEATTKKVTASATAGDKRRAQWVTKEVIEKRRAANQCLRCGSKDHFIKGCNQLPAKPPGSQKPKVAVVDEEKENDTSSDGGDESEKE
jgi:Retrotransposon gag protein